MVQVEVSVEENYALITNQTENQVNELQDGMHSKMQLKKKTQ